MNQGGYLANHHTHWNLPVHNLLKNYFLLVHQNLYVFEIFFLMEVSLNQKSNIFLALVCIYFEIGFKSLSILL